MDNIYCVGCKLLVAKIKEGSMVIENIACYCDECDKDRTANYHPDWEPEIAAYERWQQ